MSDDQASHDETNRGSPPPRDPPTGPPGRRRAFAARSPLVWSALALALGSAIPAEAGTYACGNASAGHCYAINAWSRAAEYFGAYANIGQEPLSCPSGCGGFVDNELWLIDPSTAGCVDNSFGVCWVEAGSLAYEGISPVFFWADSRPTTESTYNLHVLGPTDPDGTVDHYMIVKDGRVTPNTFLVFIYNDSQSTLYAGTSAISSGTPMSGTQIHIGQELGGTGNASASLAIFTRNIWATQALDSDYVFWYQPQTTEGSVTDDAPPTGVWLVDPANPPSGCGTPPEGGAFSTSCCD